MRVIFYCGYYPDRAHKQLKPRTEDYWNAYFYVWAVKVGKFRKNFYILTPNRLNITSDNFSLVRRTFGSWASEQLQKLSKAPPSIVPVCTENLICVDGMTESPKLTQ
jgi:hypothetical protein